MWADVEALGMTLPNYDQIIEAMAKALVQVDYPGNDYYYNTMADDFKLYKKSAKAALQAMLAMLPELKPSCMTVNKPMGCQSGDDSIWPAIAWHDDENAAKYYREILEMREPKGDNDANITK